MFRAVESRDTRALAALQTKASPLSKRRESLRRSARSNVATARRGLVFALILASASCACAADTVVVGTVGSASANLWPVFIGLNKGLFAENDIKVDLVYVQSSAAVVAQVTAGSLDVTMSTGLVDPIRAVEKGAPIAIVRFESQSPPYALVAKPSIKSLRDLKGKVISLGGAKDITRIYVERMLAPSGIKPGEFDMVFAGATAARAAALQSGAVDAAILLPPSNFQAVANGFNELGLAADFTPELPFSGTVVNVPWANAHKAILLRLLDAHAKAVAWFEDDHNRVEAVAMMVKASGLKAGEVEKAYDFYRKGNFFEPSGRVSIARLKALMAALESLGDLPPGIDVNRLLLPGMTAVSD
jgi:ABC-type nitrate/sulfonate/bicarbonate transport system substrate-binding protein